jgi:tRNA1Val (adenine37-N6)-methyltransferase
VGVKKFSFKLFEVVHQQSSMPIGTDAVLLGAWAAHEVPGRILDIGTGCGVIALMLGQRYTEATIDAVDIDEASIQEATENFKNSPFADRLLAEQLDVKDLKRPKRFDLIVSNPPYFTESVLSPEQARANARHGLSLNYGDLLWCVNRLLGVDGNFCCVLPEANIKAFILKAEANGLIINKITNIQYNEKKPVSVSLLRFSRYEEGLEIDTLILHDEQGKPTEEYKALVAGFYLWA